MKISKVMLEALAPIVMSRRQERMRYADMYQMLNGGAYELVSKAIRAEFSDPNAVSELEGRLVPINIFKKVIHKMAAVYQEAPLRTPVDENSSDAELLEDYEDALKINIRQKQSNRYLEAFGKNLKEFFTGKDGTPYIKNLPPQTYEVFNIDNPDKAQADIVCKIIVDDSDPSACLLYWYSDESYWATDGGGAINKDVMNAKENPNGKNPAKTLPFVYKCKSTDSVNPEIDDSLLRVSISLPIVLTDLFFACKYQCWSIIYTIGVTGKINRNPSSIIALNRAEGDEKDPVIDQISPTVDSDKVISLIEAALNMFLSSLGLSAGTISLGTNARDVVSGVSKVLDSAEVIEGKKDQQEDMLDDENMTWAKLKVMVPYWRRNQKLNSELNGSEFSKTFKVSISYKDPKPMMSEDDSLNISEKKIKLKLTTWTRELKNAYPDYTDDQIEDLKTEILEEMEMFPTVYNPMMMATEEPDADEVDNSNPNDSLKKSKGKKNGLQSKVPSKFKKGVQ